MLRCVGRLGVPRRRQGLCRNAAGNARLSQLLRTTRTAFGQRIWQGSSSQKEVNYDHEWNNAPAPGNLGNAGLAGLGGCALAGQCHLAQKPEEKKEITIIVKADDESAEPTEAVATIDDGEFTINTNFVATAEDDGKPTEVRVEVKTDDSTDKVVAESLDQAIKKIKEQIEVIKKETKSGEQQKVRVRALESVVRQLENSARQTKTLKQIAGKKEEVRRAIVNRVGKIEEVRTAKEEVRRAIVQTPEMRAEINKATPKSKS